MATIRDLLLARTEDDSPALRWREGDTIRTLTWREYVAAAARLATVLQERLDPVLPPHVGVLLDNGPAWPLHLAAAGLGGHVVVGLNTTRRGSAQDADIAKADCQFVVDTPAVALAAVNDKVPVSTEAAPTGDDLFMLIFTSGTSGDPKAVRVTHHKVTAPAAHLTDKLGLTRADVHYCSMPMFHSNAVLAAWGPAVHNGAAFCCAPFSASRFIDDVRDFGATFVNYVGKPLTYILSTEPRTNDADNPLRLAFGNEAGDRDMAAFAQRFDCRVVDGFGSTENAVVISRTPDTPPGALGAPAEGVKVLDPETGEERPPAHYDEHGAITNLDDAVGELVNTRGAGQFAGYYNDEAATAERLRGGMYWSGDLAYRDTDGWIHFAGRTSDWLRVDGENLAAAPIERILLRHPAINEAAVFGVPDPQGGDQLAVALVLRAELSPTAFGDFLDQQEDLGPKQWPRLVRVVEELPRTATNKVLKRRLDSGGFDWERQPRERVFRPSGSQPSD